MEIKKFEAYNYRGPSLDKMTRSKFIEELSDLFMDQHIVGYKVGGSTYFPNDEILWLHVDKEENGKFTDAKIIKLDLSDLGIEIGTSEWNDDTEEFEDFIPELNLNTEISKQVKDYKQSIKNYNV